MGDKKQYFEQEAKKTQEQISEWQLSLWLTFFIFVCGSLGCGVAAALLIPGAGPMIAVIAIGLGVLVFVYQVVRVQIHKSRLQQELSTLQRYGDMAGTLQGQPERTAQGTSAPAAREAYRVVMRSLPGDRNEAISHLCDELDLDPSMAAQLVDHLPAELLSDASLDAATLTARRLRGLGFTVDIVRG